MRHGRHSSPRKIRSGSHAGFFAALAWVAVLQPAVALGSASSLAKTGFNWMMFLAMVVVDLVIVILLGLLAANSRSLQAAARRWQGARLAVKSGEMPAPEAAPPPFGNQSSTTLAPVLVSADIAQFADSIEKLMAQTETTARPDGHLEPDQYSAVVKLVEAIERSFAAASEDEQRVIRQNLHNLEGVLANLLHKQDEVRVLRDALQQADEKMRELEQANARLTSLLAERRRVSSGSSQRGVSPAAAGTKAISEPDLAALRSVLTASMGGNAMLAGREFDALHRAVANRPPAALIKALFENDRSGLRWVFRRAESAGGNWTLQWMDVDASRRQLSEVIGRHGLQLIWPEPGDAFDDARHRIAVDENPHHHAHGHVKLLVRPGVECPGDGYIWPAIVET